MRVRKMKEDREAPRAALLCPTTPPLPPPDSLPPHLYPTPSPSLFLLFLCVLLPVNAFSDEHLINPTIAPTSFYLYPIYPNYTNNNPTLRP
ncbi:hypothetical protein AAFF_G00388540 [Aldrovandia affinis]|uniref:Uncharacterized protein n=1 Tax=Aldrovandia affinis TaxID=143900 RepID=A0AAD7VYY6_9TELE|nr:hypothetical protein AAFF_G00388540 [Aldrovandia affinis]